MPEDTTVVFREFQSVMDTIENEWLRKLVDAFFSDQEFVKKFSAAAACETPP